MNRCERCLMPDTRPDMEFVNGVCSACIAYETRPKINWTEREAQLKWLLERAKRETEGKFDCIVPSSGGKDSHYQTLKLIELGAHPLVVTATTCHLTKMGRMNIQNLGRYATTIEVTPNRTVRAKLNRIGLRFVGDISWPEHVSIFTIPFAVSKAFHIPLIFYGENPQNEYGGPLDSQEARQMTQRWISEFGGFNGLRPSDLVGLDGIKEEDMRDYTVDAWDKTEAHFLGQYIPWESHRNGEIAAQAGMVQVRPSIANWWSFENIDNAQTGIHDFFMYLKYGYNRATAQLSVDIRQGRISRDTGLALLGQHEGKFPYIYMDVPYKDILANIGMEKEEFWGLADGFTNRDIFGDIQWRLQLA